MATDRPRLGSGDASLSPELIAQRGFLTSRRGFDPDEVKTFLARIAEEFRSMRQREATLERALRDAEERAAHPTLDENTLMAAVGEETASILRSAHAAAADITTKAKDNAARILRESHEQAAAMRQDAETVLGRRTTEADAAAARIREAGEAEVEQLRQGARQEGETVRAQAEAERKVTIEAAQGARERILSDLTRRRKVAVVQIEQLRVGRERLLEAYKVVRRTLDEVTDELQKADGEARAAAEAAGRRPLPALVEEEVGGVEGAVAVKNLPAPSGPSVPAPSVPAPVVAGAAPAAAGSAPPPKQEVEAKAGGADEGGAEPGRPSPAGPGPSGGAVADAEAIGSGGRVTTRVLEERRPLSLRVLRRQKDATGRPPDRPRPPSGEASPADETSPAELGETEAATDLSSPEVDLAPTEEDEGVGTPPPDAEGPAEADHAPEDGAGGPSVDDLFARIRADRERAVADAREVLADTSAETMTTLGDAEVAAGVGDPVEAAAAEAPVTNEDEALLQLRDEAVGPIEISLARKLKRALQDEQNDLLDRLRGLRTQPTATLVLPGRATHAERFASAGRPMLDKAAKAGAAFFLSMTPGATAASTDDSPDLDDLAATLAAAIVDPLRARLERAFIDGYDDDPAVLAESLGAAYREWKTQRIEQTAADHVATAFARGAFASTPEATPLRWLVEDVEGPCPDCDDNALAGGLPKGEPFPTGQQYPPAHAGCRCLLVPVRS